MKLAHKKGWSLVLETSIVATAINGFFMWLLFNTSMGDEMPGAIKIGGPIFVWIVSLCFFFAHRTRDGAVEFKVR